MKYRTEFLFRYLLVSTFMASVWILPSLSHSETAKRVKRKPAQARSVASPPAKAEATSDQDQLPKLEAKMAPVVSPLVLERIAKSEALIKEKKFEEAVTNLRPIVEMLPRSGLLTLSRAYAGQNDTINEIRTLELCLAKNPQDYVVMTHLGNAYSRAKKSDEAIERFHEARKINRRYRPLYEGLLKELESTGHFYEARALVQDMIKIFGQEPALHTALCRLLSTDSFLAKSVEVCENATKTDPKVPENFVHLAVSLKDMEEMDSAIKVMQRASKRFPSAEIVHSTMGDLYLEKREFPKAHEAYKKATLANPKSARAMTGHANAAFELQRYDEALKAYIGACRINRNETKDFRVSLGKLRTRSESNWQSRFADGLSSCNRR